ncbi:MAG: rod shape-determining protein MreC [bacterium]
MMRTTTRKAERRQLAALLLITILVALILGWWSGKVQKSGARTPIDNMLLKVLSLSVNSSGSIANRPNTETTDGITDTGLSRLRDLEEENQKLRLLLNLSKNLPGKPFGAQIVGRSTVPWEGYLLVPVGTDDGISPRMAAVSADGVVGQVVSATKDSANILPLTDPASGIGAKVVRLVNVPSSDPLAMPITQQKTIAVGVLKGYNAELCTLGQCSLEYIVDTADVQPGDKVVTSGLGSVFGKLAVSGIPLGVVDSVKVNKTLSILDIAVTPAANPSNVSWVALVK